MVFGVYHTQDMSVYSKVNISIYSPSSRDHCNITFFTTGDLYPYAATKIVLQFIFFIYELFNSGFRVQDWYVLYERGLFKCIDQNQS